MLYSELYREDNWIGFYITKLGVNRDGMEELIVRAEKRNDSEAFAEMRLPARRFFKSFGFSEDELFDMGDYIISNEPLIWEMARED